MRDFFDTFLLGFFSFALPFTYLLGNRKLVESENIGKYFKQVGDYLNKGIGSYEQTINKKN